MGLLRHIIKVFSSSSWTQRQRQGSEPPIRLTPEEWVPYEQEQAGDEWHGIPLSELSKLARTIYHGKYVKVDQNGFLLFCYTSNSGKSLFEAQCDLDENGQLRSLSAGYYFPNQWRDAADDFVEKANETFSFI